jgi:integrase
MRSVAGLYKIIHRFHQLDQKNPFASLTIPGGKEGKRLAYVPSFVQSHFLAEGMFDGLNDEARRIIYLIIETGLRLSEACALTRKTIHLDTPVPYVEVADEDRELKTPGSARCVPLVGVALLAMQKQPNGFPRYRDKADTLSGLVNQVLTEKKLRPGGKKQTLYSLRHTLVDRLIAVEAPEKIQEDLLGHVHMYGEGSTLKHRHQWLMKIAFKPPSSV